MEKNEAMALDDEPFPGFRNTFSCEFGKLGIRIRSFLIRNSVTNPKIFTNGTRAMMKIKYVDIPQWLQDSIFYRNLSDDEADNVFELPAECFRATDDSVHTIKDVTAVLTVMRFWGVSCIPHNVLQFCYLNEMVIWSPVVAEVLGDGLPEHHTLKMAFEYRNDFTLEKALQTRRSEFVSFWLCQLDAGRVNSDHAIAHACRFGRTELVATLRERGLPWNVYACCAAAQYGHFACLQYLHEKGCPFNEKELIYAARGGQLECMKYLHTSGCLWHEDVTLEYAVPHGHDHWNVRDDVDLQPWSDDWSVAIPAIGYLECLQYALENGCPVHTDATSFVAEYGLLDCLQLLYLYGAEWNAETTYAAACFGRLDCLAYAHENGCPWNETVVADAATAGQLVCLQYLHDNGCPWDNTATHAAAKAGQLGCLMYLHTNGCPWDTESPMAAAERNHFECLLYLHQNGCPWDGKTVDAAARRGHLECLRYAVENGCICTGCLVLIAALRAEDTQDCLNCLRFLVEECNLYQDLDATLFCFPFREGKIDVVKYLAEVGCPIKDYVFAKPGWVGLSCADAGFLQCMQYAVERGWQYNNNLLAFIEERDLSLCQAYVAHQGWKGKRKLDALSAV